MNQKILLLTCTAVLALGLAGCNKSEPVTTTADDDAAAKTAEAAKVEATKADQAAKVEAAKAAEAAKVEAAKAAEAAEVEAAKAAEAAKVAEAAKAVEAATAAETANAANNKKVEGLIDKAKGLIAESKFSDASGVLQQITALSLTSGQQKLVDGLKEQIQKALVAKAAENAAGAAGNLLK